MNGMRQILVADVSAGLATIRNVLGVDVDLVHATTIFQATKLLRQETDMILCGIHFDESRMFDLLRVVKADIQYRKIPFLCFRDLESDLERTLFESLEISCKALGAEKFVDLWALKKKFGVSKADEEFRRIIVNHL
jgi:hypothetical protein